MVNNVITYLEGQSAITALVGASPNQRIFASKRPRRHKLPCIVVRKIDTLHLGHLVSASGLATAQLELTMYATTYAGADSLADLVRLEMDGYTSAAGLMDTLDVHRVMLSSENDTVEQNLDGSDTATYGRIHDYDIQYVEAIPTF